MTRFQTPDQRKAFVAELLAAIEAAPTEARRCNAHHDLSDYLRAWADENDTIMDALWADRCARIDAAQDAANRRAA